MGGARRIDRNRLWSSSGRNRQALRQPRSGSKCRVGTQLRPQQTLLSRVLCAVVDTRAPALSDDRRCHVVALKKACESRPVSWNPRLRAQVAALYSHVHTDLHARPNSFIREQIKQVQAKGYKTETALWRALTWLRASNTGKKDRAPEWKLERIIEMR